MDSEPAKKRKRILSEPEGFLPSKKPQQQQRIHAPNFQSTFDKPSSSKKPMGVPVMPQHTLPERRNPVPMSRRPAPLPPEPQSVKSLKRPEPPVLPRTEPPSKVMKALPPALPVIPTTPMKALQTPELPISPDTKGMKPLSTIPLSDISSNDDSVELSSILLQLQQHNPEPKQQDVLISPQKNKHVRGGLAERASRMYKKSHTSLYLWRTAMESKPTQQSEITFRVCKVLHTIFTGSHKPSLSITLSRVHLPVRPFISKKHLVYVITKFPDSSKTTSSCNPADLKEGCCLDIWRPWHEIPLVLDSSNSGLSDTTLPSASLPLPSSNESLSISPNESVHNIVLLCSRFSIHYFVFESSPAAANPSFERVLLKQYAAEQGRKQQGKQQKFLQVAESKLSQDITSMKETTKACIEQLEKLYATFTLEYASCEDKIGALWDEVLNLNETYAAVLDDVERSDSICRDEMEERQVSGLTKVRNACEDHRKIVEQVVE